MTGAALSVAGPATPQAAAERLASGAGVLVASTDLCVVLGALDRRDRRAAQAICAAYLEDTAAGMPSAGHWCADLRADAAFWADTATPAELEAYTAAGLRAIERTPFGLAATRRIVAALLARLPADDLRAIARRLDPRGIFAGAAPQARKAQS